MLPHELDEKVTSLAAAGGKQVASWDEEAKHGLFTHHTLDALYGAGDENGDGIVTAIEVKKYLDEHMTRAARRQHRRIQQAALIGARDVVLASAIEDGTFSMRPALKGNDVPLTGGEDVEAVVAPEESYQEQEKALGLTHARRVLVQHGLAALEFDVGLVDGVFGPRTRAAIAAYQKTKGWTGTGYLGAEQSEALIELGQEAQRRVEEEQLAERQRLAEEAKRKAAEEELRLAEEKRREAERERRTDDEAFARAKNAGTVAAYVEYLRRYPSGRHAAQARRLRTEGSRSRRVGEVFRDCPQCPRMVVVPAGTYRMGSPKHEEGRLKWEGPVHEVRIAKPFAVGVYEVTRAQWNAFASKTGYSGGTSCFSPENLVQFEKNPNAQLEIQNLLSWRDPGFTQSDAHPVVCMNWDDAKSYAWWLSRETGKEYRLLSEAEWEYAARAGTSTSRHWGNSARRQCQYENAGDITLKVTDPKWKGKVGTCRDGYAYTSAVGSFSRNAYGLYDVLGNAMEWTSDCWNENYTGAPIDGSAWEQGECSLRVMRGSIWGGEPQSLRSAVRFANATFVRFNFVGFRVAQTLKH